MIKLRITSTRTIVIHQVKCIHLLANASQEHEEKVVSFCKEIAHNL